MCDLFFTTISYNGAQLCIVLVTSVTFLFYIKVINDGLIYQPKRTGVYNTHDLVASKSAI